MRELEESRSPSAHRSRRRTPPVSRTAVTIHVYDLLQPGKLSSLLWHLGGGLLHSGVVVGNKEFAYGGHEEKGVSGVYWNHPREEPPGCTFRAEVHQGYTSLTTQEVDKVVRELSHSYLGTDWNLLTRNCNHFTAALCRKLTVKPVPGWLNRAANIGITIPCMIPREILSIPAPDAETAEGALVQDEAEVPDDRETNPLLQTDTREGTERNLRLPHERQTSVTSWYDDDDGDDDPNQSKDNLTTKRSVASTFASLSRTTSASKLLDYWPAPAPVVSTGDLRKATKGRAKMKIKDGQGRILRVSARVP